MKRLTKNPTFPEGINTSLEHPLKEFGWLVLGVTGFIAVAVIVLALAAQWLAPLIPFRYEESLTSAYEATTKQRVGNASGEADATFLAAQEAIAGLGHSLADRADLPESMTLHFHLLEDSETPNAFATLGGHIFVTTALLTHVTSENALAMVLAHEIAHIKYRHPIQSLSRGLLVQVFLAGLTGNQDSGVLQGILGQTGLLTLLQFNRNMEQASDTEALAVLETVYGHTLGADEFFNEMLAKSHQPAWQEVFQTHPNIEKRIKRIREPRSNKHALTASTDPAPVLIPIDSRIVQYLSQLKLQDQRQ